jgi:hypothetical protein
MRYIQIPEPITVRNPITDEPDDSELGRAFPFAKSVRLALMSIAKKADSTTVHDLRTKIDRAEVGEWVELSDDEWKLLEAEMRRPDPAVVSVNWTLSAKSHQDAVLDARRELPATIRPNGVDASDAVGHG